MKSEFQRHLELPNDTRKREIQTAMTMFLDGMLTRHSVQPSEIADALVQNVATFITLAANRNEREEVAYKMCAEIVRRVTGKEGARV